MTVYDETAEKAVIGGALISPALLADLVRAVAASDFYDPGRRRVFAEIEDRHAAGEPIDANVIAAATGDRDILADCISNHGSSATTLTLARTVAELAAVRDVQRAAMATLARIDDGVRDPLGLIDALETDVAAVSMPHDPRRIGGLYVVDELLDSEFAEPPWAIPGLLREGWRLLFVGAEGGGKSTMLRQIVSAAAVGQHPFTFAPIDPVPGLIIDVENPEGVIRDGLRLMNRNVRDAELTILSRPGGIDIRSRRDRDLLHRVFDQVQPKVASIGPLYKLYRQDRRESDEQAAIDAQNVLDDIRIKHGCALVLETHAPKGSGSIRDLIPFGSSAWMRWPELGWKLLPCDDRGNPNSDGKSVKVGRFRGDRVQVETPAYFTRSGGGWPWSAYWPNGIPREKTSGPKFRPLKEASA